MTKNGKKAEGAPGANAPVVMSEESMRKAFDHDMLIVASLIDFVRRNSLVKDAIIEQMLKIQANQQNPKELKEEVFNSVVE